MSDPSQHTCGLNGLRVEGVPCPVCSPPLVEQMRALCDDSLRVPNPTSSVAYAQLLGDANIQIDASHVKALLDALAGAEKEKTAAEAGRILTQESMQRWIDFHNARADKAEASLARLREKGKAVVTWGRELQTALNVACQAAGLPVVANDPVLDAFAELGFLRESDR